MSALTLAEAKRHLNITVTTYDAELQEFIEAAEATIAKEIGALEPESVSENVYAAGGVLVLTNLPVASLTSITPYGDTALSLTDVDVSDAGVVTYLTGLYFADSSSPYVVVYEKGRETLPKGLLLAVKELTRHLWETQRGSGTARPGSTPQAPTVAGAAYALPIRVEQLIAPYRTFGFA